jgi:hypothetical protein
MALDRVIIFRNECQEVRDPNPLHLIFISLVTPLSTDSSGGVGGVLMVAPRRPVQGCFMRRKVTWLPIVL